MPRGNHALEHNEDDFTDNDSDGWHEFMLPTGHRTSEFFDIAVGDDDEDSDNDGLKTSSFRWHGEAMVTRLWTIISTCVGYGLE